MYLGLSWLRCFGIPGKNTCVALLVCLLWVSAIFVYNSSRSLQGLNAWSRISSNISALLRNFEREEGQEKEQESLNRECTFPGTNPFDPALTTIVKKYPPLDCSRNTPNIVYIENFIVKVNRTKLRRALLRGQRFKHCRYKEIFRQYGSDKTVYFGVSSATFIDRIELEPQHKNIVVECYSTKNSILSRSYFHLVRVEMDTESYLKNNYEQHLRRDSPSETLSILMIGIDGMSKQNFERAMPKTRNFVLNVLGGTELRKFNKVGLNTLPNVTPLLTGKTWQEVRNLLQPDKSFLDSGNHLFLWSEARKLGYRTGLILDSRDVTSFHYMRKGFKVAPVDYYLRPTLLAWGADRLMHGRDKNCLGDRAMVSQLYDYWLQMARTFRSKSTPYFGYSFSAVLTHDDCNLASKGDDLYHQFLQDLVATGTINNTVIVWFSDHGQRFGRIRSTYQGRVETNTPYMFFILPPWFKKKYPDAMRVLNINQDRLTTHFDVYETLMDLLYFQGVTGNGTIKQRGISLFKEIPRERTCAQAGVPVEFCACAHFSQPLLDEEVRQQLGAALLNRVNSFTEHIADECARLSIVSINSIFLVRTNSLRTMKSKSFRVVITAKPGLGTFEGLVQLSMKTGLARVAGEVVRTNLYRGQADCVVNPTLRQFCFCTV
ncbi:hypothetical protein ElyMa_002023900 [Elysia marginata]|uniref:Sulfatase N-terminal domain-containing protein n=1 Tax=Elysia marginata TaxID=1093978 RepID=A0AAV4F5J8_9GAST|nr:hypothetical protein ElyMa_002023900 [Elysia marginata]